MTEQHKHAAILAALVAVFLTGRASVGGVSHTDECDPEISALEVAELTGKVATAEARGLERCVQREREACEERISAAEEAGDALDCLICRKRCPNGSIP
jgi:hypothetical protein